MPDLHQRASDWFEANGERSAAIRHALAGRHFERAADLVELLVQELRRTRQDTLLRGWLAALPDDVIRLRPVVSIGYVWALLAAGDLDGADARLNDAERWLDTTHGPADMVVVDEEEFSRLAGSIAVYRAALAQVRGDGPATVMYARRVLDLVPEDQHLQRGAAAALIGLAAWTSGDLETAYRTYSTGMADVQKAGNISDAMGGAIALADIRIAQGRLHDAMRIYEHALHLAEAQTTLVVDALLWSFNNLGIVFVAVFAFPLLRKLDEALAVGYLASRIIEGTIMMVGIMATLLLIPLSQQFLAAGAPQNWWFMTLGDVLMQAKFLGLTAVSLPMLGLGGLFFTWLLFRFRLVPRLISVWGLIGYLLLIPASVAGWFGLIDVAPASAGAASFLAVPAASFEIILLPFWLLFRGFKMPEKPKPEHRAISLHPGFSF